MDSKAHDGESFLPLINDPKAELSKRSLFWHFPHYPRMTPGSAVRNGDWKLIHYYEDDRRELYNLRNDPGEQHNLADKDSETAKRLCDELAESVAVLVRTVFGSSIVSSKRPAEAKIGAREWIVLAFSPAYVWFLVAHPDLNRSEVLVALTWGLIGIALLTGLFRSCLANRKRFGIITTGVLIVGLSLIVGYFYDARQWLFSDGAEVFAASQFSALIGVLITALVVRAYGRRVMSERRVEATIRDSNPVAFGLSELFVWVAASGSSMAILGLLSQSY